MFTLNVYFLLRLQLEERLAQEARERRQDDRRLEDKKLSSEELRMKSSHNDVRKSPVDDRRKDQVQFVLGGDKWVYWIAANFIGTQRNTRDLTGVL